jgi:hypothetical protein
MRMNVKKRLTQETRVKTSKKKYSQRMMITMLSFSRGIRIRRGICYLERTHLFDVKEYIEDEREKERERERERE